MKNIIIIAALLIAGFAVTSPQQTSDYYNKVVSYVTNLVK